MDINIHRSRGDLKMKDGNGIALRFQRIAVGRHDSVLKQRVLDMAAVDEAVYMFGTGTTPARFGQISVEA